MRFDKYDPISGGFRAPLNAAYTGSANAVGVGINSSGLVVVGVGVAGIAICGVICSPLSKNAGDIIDVMTAGEIVDVAGLAAGTLYTASTTTGAISSGAPSLTQVVVGWTVEATRLIVRVATPQFIGT
jgi:hypothetical protein